MSVSSFEKLPINVGIRINIALVTLASVFFILLLRLWYLQIIRGDYFRELSEQNHLQAVYLPPPRGLIVDRTGQVLAKNRPSFNIELIPENSPDPRATLTRLAEIVGVDPAGVLARSASQPRRRRFEPRLILKDISRDVVAKVEANVHSLPGILINVVPLREYVHGDFASHVLGYVREVSRSQLDNIKYAGYRQGDMVGQFGIEDKKELLLRGERGVQIVEVNNLGTRVGETSYQPSLVGNTVKLTLDADVQEAAEQAMGDNRGAIVAMDVHTGEILAMVSRPSFDPNAFARELTSEQWSNLVSGRDKPLNNRALQGTYPPGSVFKIWMSVAILAEDVMKLTEKVFCPGYFNVGRAHFRCHKKEGHGPVALHDALVRSCDVYYYTAGQRLGVNRIHDWTTHFGLGIPTGLDLVHEARGLIPSEAWKRAFHKRFEDQKWYPGETPSVSIGQGAVSVTPMQIAVGLAAVVNGGKVLRPQLVKEVTAQDGRELEPSIAPIVLSEVQIDPKILDIVRAAMVGVVNEPGGTGAKAKLSPELGITVGGKTGTAQAASASASAGRKDLGDHAWFAGFAPAEKPEIVVVSLSENSGHGGVVSAPKVAAVMERYFRKARGLPFVPPTPTPIAKVAASKLAAPAIGGMAD